MRSEKPLGLIEAKGPQADLELTSEITDQVCLLVLSVRAALSIHVEASPCIDNGEASNDAVRTKPIPPLRPFAPLGRLVSCASPPKRCDHKPSSKRRCRLHGGAVGIEAQRLRVTVTIATE